MEWYLKGLSHSIGPFDKNAVLGKIKSGELRPHELVFCNSQEEWKPLVEWGCFPRESFPCFQQLWSRHENEQAWILCRQVNANEMRQEGPLSLSEIKDKLKIGQLSDMDLIWTHGMTGWSRIEDRPELKQTKIVGNTEILW